VRRLLLQLGRVLLIRRLRVLRVRVRPVLVLDELRLRLRLHLWVELLLHLLHLRRLARLLLVGILLGARRLLLEDLLRLRVLRRRAREGEGRGGGGAVRRRRGCETKELAREERYGSRLKVTLLFVLGHCECWGPG
jgi:hypothetical protein